jgi:hypothetical protein
MMRMTGSGFARAGFSMSDDEPRSIPLRSA